MGGESNSRNLKLCNAHCTWVLTSWKISSNWSSSQVAWVAGLPLRLHGWGGVTAETAIDAMHAASRFLLGRGISEWFPSPLPDNTCHASPWTFRWNSGAWKPWQGEVTRVEEVIPESRSNAILVASRFLLARGDQRINVH